MNFMPYIYQLARYTRNIARSILQRTHAHDVQDKEMKYNTRQERNEILDLRHLNGFHLDGLLLDSKDTFERARCT
jgi:hypothetical protein